MRYLQSYILFENNNQDHPLMDAMKNTPAGRDLAAISSQYRVDRTGKLVISGLRGKTFIQELPGGVWKHWVVATGRTYGEGVYSTLEDCLRGCWRDYILYSTSIRPQGMNMKLYQDEISKNLHKFEGRELNHQEITKEALEILVSRFKNPIRDASFIFNDPKWRQILALTGFEEVEPETGDWDFGTTRRFRMFGESSLFVKVLIPDDLIGPVEPNAVLSRRNHILSNIGVSFAITVEPWEVFKISFDYRVNITIGGDSSMIPEYLESIWTNKKLIKNIGTYEPHRDDTPELVSAVSGMRKIAADMIVSVGKGIPIDLSDFYDKASIALKNYDISAVLSAPSPHREEILRRIGYDANQISSMSKAKDIGIF